MRWWVEIYALCGDESGGDYSRETIEVIAVDQDNALQLAIPKINERLEEPMMDYILIDVHPLKEENYDPN